MLHPIGCFFVDREKKIKEKRAKHLQIKSLLYHVRMKWKNYS